MTASGPAPRRLRDAGFRAGPAIARAVEALSRNFVGFVLLALVVTLPNYAVAAAGGVGLGSTIAAAIVSGILYYLVQGFIAWAAYQDMLGRPVSTGESLRVALGRFLPLLGLAGWIGLAVCLGFLLLILPGALLLVMWSVAVPVCVVEGSAPLASMRRSAALTQGHRWSLFLLYLLLFIAVEMGLVLLHRVLAEAGGAALAGFGSWVGQAVVAAFQAVVAVAIYHDLRLAKEGAAAEVRFG